MNFNLKRLTLKSLIRNKYILYIVALVALIDILCYIMKKEYTAVLFFYLVGMITYYYTKNMTLVLGTSLIVTTLVHLIKNMMGLKEGFKEKIDNFNEEEQEEAEEEQEQEQEQEEEEEEQEEEEDEEEDEAAAAAKAAVMEKMNNVKKNITYEMMTNSKPKTRNSDKFTNRKLTPGLYNIPNKKQLEKQLGEADKIEKAYDNLEKVIGESGIKSMSNSTKELVRQQNELLKGLKNITPALNEAMGAIGKIDMNILKNIFNSTKSSLKE